MKKVSHIWFKVAVVVGALLGVLLLVESVFSYYQVSTGLVTSELRREAQQQLTLLEREARRMNVPDPSDDPSELARVTDEMLREEPQKIAWIKVLDGRGRVLVASGKSVGPPFGPDRLATVFEVGGAASEIRQTKAGKVLVTVHSVRLPRRPASGPGERGIQRGPSPRPGARFVEMALYWSSASKAFGHLRSDLIVGCAAALGLVLSMLLLWSRFPHYIRGEQLEHQMELARRVQADLLPPPHAAFRGMDFAAVYVPAWQVGGDFYDVFAAGDGRIAIVLGDVSGKGLPASVVAGLLLGAVRAGNWLRGGAEHEASSARLSELLRTRTGVERFASLFWCYYEPQQHRLYYVNAGHPAPIVVRRNGGSNVSVERLREGGPVLGVVPHSAYRQSSVAAEPGDLLILYSDGVVEAANALEEEFGEERLLAAIHANCGRSSAEIRDEILNQVHSFLGKVRAEDDLTLVVARIDADQTSEDKMPSSVI